MLNDYLQSLSSADRSQFAVRCGTSVEYLWQIATSRRRPKAGLAVKIERESGGAVRCEALLPDVDWEYLRRKPAANRAA